MADLLSVADAASELGVNESRLRALIAAGDLSARKIGGRWLIERSALARRKREGAVSGRPLSPRNAWAALLVASGEPIPAEIDSAARWRIGQSLRHVGLVGLRARLARRARIHRFHALAGELRALRASEDVVLSGASAAGAHHLELLAPDTIDAYVPDGALHRLVVEHALQSDASDEANVVLRAVPDGAWLLAGRSVAPLAAVGVDLAGYPDSRSARVGNEIVDRLDRERAGRP